MTKIPTMEEMLKAGVHFGHQISRRNPKMQPYLFGERNGVAIIDLAQTQTMLKSALAYVHQQVAGGKIMLFVGTKKQAQALVKQAAEECGMPYITEGWIGGLLTNFNIIHRVIKKYLDLKSKIASGELRKYTKKEQLEFKREVDRLDKMVGGVQTLKKIPDLVFIVDIHHEKTALREALKKKVPIVALCDANTNPEEVDYPIPANDDAIKSLAMMISLVTEAVKEGKNEAADLAARAKTTATKGKAEIAPSTSTGLPAKSDVVLALGDNSSTTITTPEPRSDASNNT